MKMQGFKENLMLASILLFVFALLKGCIPWTAFVTVLILWILRTRDHSWILLSVFLILIMVPRVDQRRPETSMGRAVQVSQRYAVVQNGTTRVLVYTKGPLLYDADYEVTGKLTEITKAKGFYRFDAERWAEQIGVKYVSSENEPQLIREHTTFRSLLQKHIMTCSPELQPFLYKLLLNIRPQEEEDSFLFSRGFTYAGILAAVECLLKYFIDRKKRKKVLWVIGCLLCIVYGFPFLLVQTLLFRALSFTSFNRYERCGLGLCLVITLYPAMITSVSFLIPAVYRISILFDKRKLTAGWIALMIQSLTSHCMEPVTSFCYPFLKALFGSLWIAAFAMLWMPLPFFGTCLEVLDKVLSILDCLRLPGSMFGPGLFAYMLILCVSRKSRHFTRTALIWLLVFQAGGFFHPFAELTFIDVGQGDSILIRQPFDTQNILVDTGKPSQWKNVKGYLEAEGIRRIHTLIITHADEDHSGNRDEVIRAYHPDQVIETHQKKIICGKLILSDLSEMESDEPNEASLMQYFSINGLKFLVMGDCTKKSEEALLRKYGGLKCDVLKLGHHGSNTSTGDHFLDTVRPALGIVSSGAYSIYHHPSPETVQRLLARHIPYLDTKEEGDITILFLPMSNLLLTSGGSVGIIGR